jgi:transposase
LQTLDLIFIDTTSTLVYRTEATELRRRGYSRDRMPDCPQVVICLAVDQHGWPVAWDLLPGNTADTGAFVAVIKKLRERFRIGRVVVVADRGMISKDTRATPVASLSVVNQRRLVVSARPAVPSPAACHV